jgi:hypothetical protein
MIKHVRIKHVSENWDKRCVSKLLGLKMCFEIRIKDVFGNWD